jgi:hypothetical protein
MHHKKSAKRLVIDACVAQSAGETDHPISSCCRRCLIEVERCGHHLVMSPDISVEWKKHGSNFATRWRASMVARRRVVWLPHPLIEALRESIERIEPVRCRPVVRKDIHLIEAALASDRTVISRDTEALQCMRAFANIAARMQNVMWICPVVNADRIAVWLRRGAARVRSLCLGRQKP